MKYLLLSTACVIILLTSCSKMSEEEAFTKGKTAVEQRKYDEAQKYFDLIAREYPEGKRAPDALFLSGSIYQNEKRDLSRAVSVYLEVVAKYPKSEAAPKALFTAAFLHANQMNDLKKARELYEQFLRSYPNHEMASSAQVEIANLGVEPEVLLNSITRKPEPEQQASGGK
jgi:TolA-binding protein